MNCRNIRKLLDKSDKMAEFNIWGEKAYKVNMQIWTEDINNFSACKRLGKYYELNNNIPEAIKMYTKALSIYPNNQETLNDLKNIEYLQSENIYIDGITTSQECYEAGQKLTQKGIHWLAGICYLRAYNIEPTLKYAKSLGKNYNKLGEYEKIKQLYTDLIENNQSHEAKEDIEVEFKELLKPNRYENEEENIA